ncbi:DUF6056 family protein [Streptomyces capparidis]
MRPGGDDWCFLSKVRDLGVTRLVRDFYLYDNGRIANAVAVGLYSLPGPAGHQVFPLAAAVLVVGAVWAALARLWRVLGLSAPAVAPPVVAGTLALLFLVAQPNPYQTFLWPASAVSHTLPPALALAAALPALGARTRAGRRAAAAVALAAGCALGTLSEETAVVCLAVLAVLAPARRLLGPAARRTALVCAGAGAAGLVAGLAVLVTSPGARRRRERMGVDGSALAPGEVAAALRDWAEILLTLAGTWTYTAAVAVGVLLGAVTTGPARRPPRWAHALPAAAFLLAGAGATVVVRPAFGEWTTRSSRTWNDYLLLLVLVLAWYGVLLGRALRARAARRGAAALPVPTLAAAALAAVVGVAGLAWPVHRLAGETRARAAAFDRQDARLRAAAAHGERAPGYVPTPIGGLREPFALPRDRDWAATCVARYYRVPAVVPATRGSADRAG